MKFKNIALATFCITFLACNGPKNNHGHDHPHGESHEHDDHAHPHHEQKVFDVSSDTSSTRRDSIKRSSDKDLNHHK